MEVHHHPALHHEKKKWKEYFLEFIMIFLAVTLGFIAESLRESISEHERAKVFAASMIVQPIRRNGQFPLYAQQYHSCRFPDCAIK